MFSNTAWVDESASCIDLSLREACPKYRFQCQTDVQHINATLPVDVKAIHPPVDQLELAVVCSWRNSLEVFQETNPDLAISGLHKSIVLSCPRLPRVFQFKIKPCDNLRNEF